jgi:hypothetical protein
MAVGGVLALGAPLAAAGQAQAAGPAISVAASSRLPLVTGDTLVLYQYGAYASAKVHGTIAGAGAGEVARLYAQPFPYRKAATVIAAVTLSAGKASYSFTVSPRLATHYRVKLFKSKTATAPVAVSSLQDVYVALASVPAGVKACGRPACHETITLTTKVPSYALTTELAKQVHAYSGLSLSRSGTPGLPATLTLNGAKASVTRATRVSATQYKFTIRFTFTVGNDGYAWLWTECTKDAVTQDGIGLPGTHGCGAAMIPASTLYLG